VGVEHLRHQPNAVVINISSGLAYVPLIVTPAYSATKAAIHSYTVVLREQLRGSVEVIEIVPPALQTELTPAQSQREDFMPLKDESFALLEQGREERGEILVERVKFLRNAEGEGRFDATFRILNPLDKKPSA
jgi:uncharacterized oxidoreductase